MPITFHGHRPSYARTQGDAAEKPASLTATVADRPEKNINLGFFKIKARPRQTALQESLLRSLNTQPKTSSQATTGAVAPAHKAELAPEVLDLYKRVGLAVTPDTLPKSQELGRQAQLQPIGSGSISTVYLAKGTLAGSEFEYAFKPLTKTVDKDVLAKLRLTQMTGIPIHNQQVAMRNLATRAYAELLRFDVIVDTSIQVCNVPVDHSGKSVPQVGLLMAKVEGMDPAYLEFSSLETRAEVTCEITKLQLIDHLTGEVDRHTGNFKVQVSNDARAKVTGFDNDLSFGKKLEHPEGFTKKVCQFFHGCLLPPVVDQQMFDAIDSLTPEQVKGVLENKLGSEEVSAALKRLAVVKQHVVNLKNDGRIIENPRDWASPAVLSQLNPKNSYVARLEFVGP